MVLNFSSIKEKNRTSGNAGEGVYITGFKRNLISKKSSL